jgi:hypothetical protein
MRYSEMTSGRFSRFLFVLVVNLAVLLVGVVGLEIAFGNWFTPYVLPNCSIYDRTVTYQQNFYLPWSTVTVVRDKYGFRGLHQPIEAVELITVGGSTTAQTDITEGVTWQDVIHKITGIIIANAGIDGLSSNQHAAILEDWFHKIPHLSAKYFLYYTGVNDAYIVQTFSVVDPPKKRSSWYKRLRGSACKPCGKWETSLRSQT